MIERCNKCNSEELFVEIQGNRRGLFCGKCGRWQKWITKQELQIAKFKSYKIIGGNYEYRTNIRKNKKRNRSLQEKCNRTYRKRRNGSSNRISINNERFKNSRDVIEMAGETK